MRRHLLEGTSEIQLRIISGRVLGELVRRASAAGLERDGTIRSYYACRKDGCDRALARRSGCSGRMSCRILPLGNRISAGPGLRSSWTSGGSEAKRGSPRPRSAMTVADIVYFGTLASATLISAVILLRQFFRGDLRGDLTEFGTSGLRHGAGAPPQAYVVLGRRSSALPHHNCHPRAHDRDEKGCLHDRVRIAPANSLPHAAGYLADAELGAHRSAHRPALGDIASR